MKTKPLFLALLCSGASLATLSAQSGGGSGGSSGSSGASGASSGSSGSSANGTAPAPGSPITASPNAPGTTAPMPGSGLTPPAPGTPDMTSRTNRTNPPNTDASGRSLRDPLPGASTTSGAEVSTLSGLKKSDLPAVSPGTAPLGADVRADSSVPPATPLPPPTARPPLSATPVAPGERSVSPALPQTPDVPVLPRERSREAAAAAGVPDAPVLNAPVGRAATRTVTTPPPTARAEVMTQRPAGATDQVWVPGHYVLTGEEWKWIDGSWQRPPAAGATWVPGRYNSSSKRWTEGHWAPAAK